MPPSPAAQLLIVDDEEAHNKALCHTLKNEGYGVSGFTRPSQALSALRASRFDLILTDLMMPEMDGIALLQEALQLDPKLVGVVMTGHGSIDSAVNAMRAGALDYVLKPFKLSVILPVLSRALTIRQLKIDNEDLQKRLQLRTMELEATNKELEGFSYSVSHDLRAPLRSIEGFSKILLEDAMPRLLEEEKNLLHKICRSTEEMGKLIEALINLSQSARQPLSQRPVNLVALVKRVFEEQAEQIRSRKIDVQISDLPECIGDPTLLKQVFTNLISNAIKFTCQTVNPTIAVGWNDVSGEGVYFVRDNGAGFDMQYADKLFRPFQRLHSSEEFSGTGIGLSLVHRIVRRHGGRIWAEGEVGSGAVFYFTLPE